MPTELETLQEQARNLNKGDGWEKYNDDDDIAELRAWISANSKKRTGTTNERARRTLGARDGVEEMEQRRPGAEPNGISASTAEESLVSTLRRSSGSIVVPLSKWLQTSGSASTALGRVVSEVKAREERWVGVQERLTADVVNVAEKLRQKTLSVETLEATLQADPGYRDWAKEIRRLRQQVRMSDSKLQEREDDLRVVKERSAVEKAELEAAIRDAKTGDFAEKLRVQAEVRWILLPVNTHAFASH